jgi:hypothetical protein
MAGRFARRVTVGWVTLLCVGASLLLIAATMVVRDRLAPGDFGSISSRTNSSRTTPFASAAPSGSSVAAPSAMAPSAGSSPVRVRIPALGVLALVVPVHTTNGVLGVPADPQQLGWWAEGAQVGARAGTVTIDGHVDSAAAGEGALFHVGSLRGGETVLVTTASGRTVRYAVTARHSYLKSGGLPAELFRTDGQPRLVLITCGGPFDRQSGSYLDNIVVVAMPV